MSGFRTFVSVFVVMLFSICKADESSIENLEKYFFDIKFTVSLEKNSQGIPSAKRSEILDFFLKNGINKNDIHFNRATALHAKENSAKTKIIEMVRVESENLEALKLSLDKFKSFASYNDTEISNIKKKRKAVI